MVGPLLKAPGSVRWFLFVAIHYFTKWIDVTLLINITTNDVWILSGKIYLQILVAILVAILDSI